jgi:hypothetical protein
MPTLVTPARKLIYTIGAQFRSAVSEELIQRLAGVSNFINLYQHSEKQFFINGAYPNAPYPVTGVDGLAVFEFDAEIIDVWMFNMVAGAGGQTELDLKVSPTPGSPFVSIFSTTPKISSLAGNQVWVGAPGGAYVPPANTTAPVISTVNVDAGSAIRLDLLDSQGPGAENCGLIVHYRPR